MSDHGFFLIWTALVGLLVVVFAVFETWAIVIHKPSQDTLSAWVWARIGTRHGWHGWNIPLRIMVLVLFAWLAEHFAFGYV
jgi:hypothetical protein